jgi:protein involved in polysaccharide export with SLBB domain
MLTTVSRDARALIGTLLAALVVTTAGCQAPQPHVARRDTPLAETLVGSPFDPNLPPRYVLCPADKLLVRFPDEASLNQEARIRSDGMITLPYVGDVPAAQRSPAELTAELTQRYQDVLKSVVLAVIVTEEAGRRVYLGGEVRTPGALPLYGEQTLARTLLEAGGVTSHGRSDQVLVLRVRRGDATYVLSASLDRILAGTEPDVRLEPFDIVYVPETAITRINRFVEQYINRMIPTQVSFPFTTELHTQPLHVISNNPATTPAVSITR